MTATKARTKSERRRMRRLARQHAPAMCEVSGVVLSIARVEPETPSPTLSRRCSLMGWAPDAAGLQRARAEHLEHLPGRLYEVRRITEIQMDAIIRHDAAHVKWRRAIHAPGSVVIAEASRLAIDEAAYVRAVTNAWLASEQALGSAGPDARNAVEQALVERDPPRAPGDVGADELALIVRGADALVAHYGIG